ncbi:glycosyltransferase family 4 protein [Listeria grayi]|nr:glycosyltransferase family 4 protein [Listeria grayi]
MKNKRIVILCQYFHPEYVSSATLPTQMAEDLVKKGMDVDVICGWPKEYTNAKAVPKKENYKGIQITRLKYTQFNNKSKIGRIINFFSLFTMFLLRAPAMLKYDHIVVYSNPPILPFVPDLIHRLCKRDYSFVVYDIAPDNAIKIGATKPGSMIDRLMKYINKHVYKNAENVIVLGTEMKNYLLTNHISHTPENIHIIPNWYEDNFQSPIIHNEKFKTIRENYQKILLYSGNMGKLQDMDTILDFLESAKENPDLFTIFCGHGDKQAKVKTFIAENNISNAIVYDFLTGTDYSDVLIMADCCIVSLVKEGVGLGVPSKIYGYLAAEKPLIAIMDQDTDIVRQITDYQAGIHLHNGEAAQMKAFVEQNSPADLARMGKQAYEIFKNNYTRTQNTDKYYELLK